MTASSATYDIPWNPYPETTPKITTNSWGYNESKVCLVVQYLRGTKFAPEGDIQITLAFLLRHPDNTKEWVHLYEAQSIEVTHWAPLPNFPEDLQ